MILFAITRLNKPIVDILLSEKLLDHILVLTDIPETAQELSSKYQINALLLGDSLEDLRERDRQFAQDFMPGHFGDEVFPDSDLAIWEVLSLDRLKFWWNASVLPQWSDFIFDLSIKGLSRAYISFDIYSVLPWLVADILGVFSTASVTAVQMGYIGPEELQTIAQYTIDSYVVFSEVGKTSLENAGATDIRLVKGENEKTSKEAEDLEKEKLREALALPRGMTLAGLVYDKRDDFRALAWALGKPPSMKLLVYPADPRSGELAQKAFLGMPNITVLSTYETMLACDYVIAFRDPAQYPMSHLISLPGDIVGKLENKKSV